MRIARTIAEVRAGVAEARTRGARIGFVPTMGAFHAGHEELMRVARTRCEYVVVSLFVNPAQFDDPRDLAAYLSVELEDAAAAESQRVDMLFAPSREEMYPAGFSTRVHAGALAETLEGAHRPGHFDGVCTVVAKLFAIVAPDVAFFGEKDAQQLRIVSRMSRDLDLPVAVHPVPTVREPDGLAMSSRNRRLSPDDRRVATGLPRALQRAAAAVAAGETDASAIADSSRSSAGTGLEWEYLVLCDPESLARLERVDGPALVLGAARAGSVRLIDNVLAFPPSATSQEEP